MDKSNVRKVFIIGNGFDLSLGYPTRFKDFIDFCKNWDLFYKRADDKKYATSLDETNIDNMKLTYDKSVHKQVNHWDEMASLKIYCKDIENEKRELEILDSEINNNGVIQYLIENVSNIKYERWSDFENYLLELCEMCEEYERQMASYDGCQEFNVNAEFSKFLKFVHAKGSCYLANSPKKGFVASVVRADKLEFIKELSNQIKDFSKAFNIYLKLFVNKMKIPQWSNIDNNENTFVLDFNYTDFCAKIFNKAKINYIHGFQHDDNIIIGINDEDLGLDYDCLKKKFLRLSMNAKIRQGNQVTLMGQYDEFSEYLFQSHNDDLFIPTHVIIIGQSMNKVDWDILINYLNHENLYTNISICYHNTFDNQLLNLYQMLEFYEIEYDTIKNRINSGYYSFHKYSDLKSLLNEIHFEIDNFVTHKHYDLNPKEEKLLKEIINNQDVLIKGNEYITSTKDSDEDETSALLESLHNKEYIEIEMAARKIGGPSKPYLIKKLLKY